MNVPPLKRDFKESVSPLKKLVKLRRELAHVSNRLVSRDKIETLRKCFESLRLCATRSEDFRVVHNSRLFRRGTAHCSE